MLKQKLVDSGWREDLKSYTMGAPPLHCPLGTLLTETLYGRCADLIRTKGDEQLTVEQLTQEITPRGRGAATPATRTHTRLLTSVACSAQPRCRTR